MLVARAIDDRLPLARLAGRCPLLDPSRRAHSRPRHPWTLCALGVCYSSAGKVAEVEAIRDELTARARREYVQHTMLAILSAALGRLDEAFELLERACDDRDGILVYSRRYPFFSAFQHDPRMERIYRRIGLP